MKSLSNVLKLAALAVTMTAFATDGFAWGQKGHDTTCAVAENHLTCKAKRQIAEVLDGKSIVYWSNWMDNASHTPEFMYTKTWHYKNIDADETYETALQNPEGDVVTAIEAQIKALKSGTLNKEAEATALKMLVHLVGDLHCPMHMGHRNDAGGNRWQVQFFKEGTNLHSCWDSKIVESAHNWTFTEWVEQIDRVDRKAAKAIVEGGVRASEDSNPKAIDAEDLNAWGAETYEIAKYCYDSTPVGSRIMYDEVARCAPIIEQQFLRGGLRLAAILNEIYR